EGELRHLLRVVDGEDEVRRVAGRAAGVREGALVDLHDLPAELGQPAPQAVADDAAADDDDGHAPTPSSTWCIAASKSSTWRRMISSAPAPLPSRIATSNARWECTAASSSRAWSSARCQMRSAST